MKSLKGTQTEKNILTAFSGESQARNRYTYFASQAKKEGYVQISHIFEETADQEKEHAKRLFKLLEGGKVEITAQNHGFAVDAPLDRAQLTPWGHARVSHVCLNDDVVEGLELTDDDGTLLAFSVQYHPEAAAGPHDSAYLFDRFVDVMQRRKRSTTDAQEN